ncbi:hypothetical protein J3459_002378 [Metarhizium acridum]|nr:hypothetical protein J3459_002378 [Metarhizium acridum]
MILSHGCRLPRGIWLEFDPGEKVTIYVRELGTIIVQSSAGQSSGINVPSHWGGRDTPYHCLRIAQRTDWMEFQRGAARCNLLLFRDGTLARLYADILTLQLSSLQSWRGTA